MVTSLRAHVARVDTIDAVDTVRTYPNVAVLSTARANSFRLNVDTRGTRCDRSVGITQGVEHLSVSVRCRRRTRSIAPSPPRRPSARAAFRSSDRAFLQRLE